MRLIHSRAMWSILFLTVFIGSFALILTGEDAGSAGGEPKESASKEVKPENKSLNEDKEHADKEHTEGCLVDPLTLDDLKKRSDELDARAKELSVKEAELKAARSAFTEEFKKIQQVRDEVEKTHSLQKKEGEEKVAKLVETFETMSPKASAKLLVSIDEVLAKAVAGKISTTKLAKMMNVMEPEDSTRLTELMAGVARAKKSASNGAAEAAKKSEKGGEKENGTNQFNPNSAPDRSGQREPAAQKAAEKPS